MHASNLIKIHTYTNKWHRCKLQHRLQPWLSAFSIFVPSISIFSQKVGGGQKNQSSKTLFFFKLTRCIRFSPSNFFSFFFYFKLLFSLHMTTLSFCQHSRVVQTTTDLLINAHLLVSVRIEVPLSVWLESLS